MTLRNIAEKLIDIDITIGIGSLSNQDMVTLACLIIVSIFVYACHCATKERY